MEAMFRSVFTFIVTAADTLTQTMLSLNHLARGAKHRTEVVERKSITAAALSELDNVNSVAERLEEINSNADGIGDEAFKAAELFILEYQAKRKAESKPVPFAVRKADASETPDKKKSAQPSKAEQSAIDNL